MFSRLLTVQCSELAYVNLLAFCDNITQTWKTVLYVCLKPLFLSLKCHASERTCKATRVNFRIINIKTKTHMKM